MATLITNAILPTAGTSALPAPDARGVHRYVLNNGVATAAFTGLPAGKVKHRAPDYEYEEQVIDGGVVNFRTSIQGRHTLSFKFDDPQYKRETAVIIAGAAPTISGVSPGSGNRSAPPLVTISGGNLFYPTAVSFAGVTAGFIAGFKNPLTLLVQPGIHTSAVTGSVVVTTSFGSATLPSGWSYT